MFGTQSDGRPPRAIFVDRAGAVSIWELMRAVGTRLERKGWQTGAIAMSDESGIEVPDWQTSLGSFDIPVPPKRWKGDLLGQRRHFSRRFTALLDSLRPDVVHVNFAIPGIWARRVARRAGIPVLISTQHEMRDSLALHLRAGLRATCHLVDIHTYVSKTVAESFIPASRNEDRIKAPAMPPGHLVIRNGVDDAALEPLRRRPDDREPGLLVVAGRLVPKKGHRILLHALSRILQAHPHVRLLVAGSGPEESRLREMVHRNGLEEAVHFAGWLSQERLWKEIARAELTIHASESGSEGFGLALAECAFLKTPIVASSIAAFREVLGNDEGAAYWFDSGSVASLAVQLERGLSDSPEDRERLVRGALRQVRQTASLSAMLDGYASLYDSIARKLMQHA